MHVFGNSDIFVFPVYPFPTNGKGMKPPKLQKKVCQREQKDLPKARRNCMSFKQKREILHAYSKLPKMTKEKAASKLNISRPLLHKLLNEKGVIFQAIKDGSFFFIFLGIKDGSFWEFPTHFNSDTWQ